MEHIINQPWQFQAVGHTSPNPEKPSLWQLSQHPENLTGPNAAAYAAAMKVAQGLADGTLSDNTGGATLFGSQKNGKMPEPMQNDLDSGEYERSRPDLGNWAFLRPVKR
jgi:hypothetical protein